MQINAIESLEDVRLEPYRHLRTKNLTRFSGRFIAESRPLVQRLIESNYEIESILIDDSYLAEAKSWVPPHIQVLALPHTWIDELLGFHFHRGFLACGIRKPMVEFQPELASSNSRTWVAAFAIGVQDPENLGVILRTCAGLGIQDCLLGPGTADPLSRRVLRVSMGGVLKLNLFSASDPLSLLTTLHSAGSTPWQPAFKNPLNHSRLSKIVIPRWFFWEMKPMDCQRNCNELAAIESKSRWS